MATHELPLEAANLHGYFSPELEPVRSVEPGDSVRFAVPNAGWEIARGEHFASRDPELHTGHALAGPIEVRGARAGQTLAVRVDEVTPGAWGVTLSEPPHRIDWELAGGVGRGAGRTVRLAPFLGVLGMPPPEPGVHSTVPPRRWGGNIDCKELVAGTTLYLPISVDGALFSAGDGHAAQGDGEVSGTAIEAPVTATVSRSTFATICRSSGRLPAPPMHGSPSASTSTSVAPRGSRWTACSTSWSGGERALGVQPATCSRRWRSWRASSSILRVTRRS